MVSSVVSFVLVWGAITVAAALTVLAWRQRPKPGAVAFAGLMAAGTWWVATSSIGLFSTEPDLRLFLHRLEWFGIVLFPVAWLVFTLEYTSRDEYVTRRTVGLLSVVPAVTLALVWTNDLHGLVYTGRMVNVYGGDISLVAGSTGLWYWVHVVYSYVLLGTGTLLIFQLVVGARTIYRSQATALFIAVGAPWLGNLIFVMGLSPLRNLDPTPFAFLISGVAGIAAFTQFKLLDAVPVSGRIAREFVIESMDDGIVVVDTDDTIVDINPTAATILDSEPDAAIERPASDLVPAYERLRAVDNPDYAETLELETAAGTGYYELTATPLRNDHDQPTGYVVAIHEVTSRRNRIQHLDVLNRVLRHNLRNEMNVLYGWADRINGEHTELAGQIQDKAMEMVELSDKAREIDRILDNDEEELGPVDARNVLELELGRARETYPDVSFEADLFEETVTCHMAIGPVVRNLVENAAEHNDGEDPEVSLSATIEGDELVVTVRDDGPGMPTEEQAVLRSGEETPLQHSSGLGLWLVNWGVGNMGGTVTIERSDETGTVVRVAVPYIERGVALSAD
jgi:PAS domain S-box-containing protein